MTDLRAGMEHTESQKKSQTDPAEHFNALKNKS